VRSDPLEKLRFARFWIAIGFLLIGLVVYASLMRNPPDLTHVQGSDKVEHAAAYFVLTFWFSQIYAKNRVRWTIGITFIFLGVAMEYLQRMTGYRTFEYADMAADAVGVLCALLAAQTPLVRGLAVVEKRLLRFVR
jgi:VanZ family protein